VVINKGRNNKNYFTLYQKAVSCKKVRAYSTGSVKVQQLPYGRTVVEFVKIVGDNSTVTLRARLGHLGPNSPMDFGAGCGVPSPNFIL